MKLYKTIIVIWSEYPTDGVELEDLAHEATSGDAYCVSSECTAIEDAAKDPHWDGTEFFDRGDDDDDEEEHDDDDGDDDDLCDTCMRSGVEISHVDDDDNTVCVDCVKEANEEWKEHPAPPEFSLRAATNGN